MKTFTYTSPAFVLKVRDAVRNVDLRKCGNIFAYDFPRKCEESFEIDFCGPVPNRREKERNR